MLVAAGMKSLTLAMVVRRRVDPAVARRIIPVLLWCRGRLLGVPMGVNPVDHSGRGEWHGDFQLSHAGCVSGRGGSGQGVLKLAGRTQPHLNVVKEISLAMWDAC